MVIFNTLEITLQLNVIEHIFKGPASYKGLAHTLKKGEKVKVIKTHGKWLFVEIPNTSKKGYVVWRKKRAKIEVLTGGKLKTSGSSSHTGGGVSAAASFSENVFNQYIKKNNCNNAHVVNDIESISVQVQTVPMIEKLKKDLEKNKMID